MISTMPRPLVRCEANGLAGERPAAAKADRQPPPEESKPRFSVRFLHLPRAAPRPSGACGAAGGRPGPGGARALPSRKAGPAEHAGRRSLPGAAGRAAILCVAADPAARSPRQSPPSVRGSGLPEGSGRCSPSLSGPGAAEAVPVGNEMAAESLPPWRRSQHPPLRLDLPPVMHGASPPSSGQALSADWPRGGGPGRKRGDLNANGRAGGGRPAGAEKNRQIPAPLRMSAGDYGEILKYYELHETIGTGRLGL
ncbi:uncharacterized protein ACIBXB_006913 [Morphnus guianensis]